MAKKFFASPKCPDYFHMRPIHPPIQWVLRGAFPDSEMARLWSLPLTST